MINYAQLLAIIPCIVVILCLIFIMESSKIPKDYSIQIVLKNLNKVRSASLIMFAGFLVLLAIIGTIPPDV